MLEPSPECLEIAPLLDAFHDGELPESEKPAVSSHLLTCEKCQGRLREIESLVVSLRNLPRLEMPHSLQVDWSAYIDRHVNAGKETMSNAVPIKKKTEEPNVVPISSASGFSKKGKVLAAVASLILLVVAAGVFWHNPLAPKGPSLADKFGPSSPTQALIASSVNSGQESPSSANSGGAQVTRPHASVGVEPGQRTVDGDLIALYSNDANLVSEELGIATDEDGLYALKL